MATKKVTTKTKTVKKAKEVKSEVNVELNPKVWSVPYKSDLVAQVLYVMRSNARQGDAHAKTRADVRGGGRKPWKQKGTGRARAGSIRSPLWAKGGVTFVPNLRNWARKINRKMRKLAVAVILSERLRKENLEFVAIAEKKEMSETRKLFTSMLGERQQSLVVTSNPVVEMALRNVGKISVARPENLNVFVLVLAKKIVIDNECLDVIEKNVLNEK
ncbi:50S ribosomal protein L4 [bacterium]|nr:50S ribosomal protein L4 [bacterium]